ncbi:MAG: NTP transferase domain-containing protein [Bdellovibrionales bacterium]|nr:NTP transferase domain-containing protein [Bdellovibrionales bacterium]
MQKESSIPVFILAGGLGTRLSEETQLKPKPMVEIGEKPILIHIMKSYYAHGFRDFVICAGYRSWMIKEFFLNYAFQSNHIEIDHRQDDRKPATIVGKNAGQEKWRVRVIDTGANAMTGARIARAYDVASAQEKIDTFAMTYGDGLCDVDLRKELAFHFENKKVGTVLGVRPVARFGELEIKDSNMVQGFLEKPESKQGRINGGFFFFNQGFRKYLSDDESCILERAPLEKLARDKELCMYQHDGFWHPMDTLRDKNYLNDLWIEGKAPWWAE